MDESSARTTLAAADLEPLVLAMPGLFAGDDEVVLEYYPGLITAQLFGSPVVAPQPVLAVAEAPDLVGVSGTGRMHLAGVVGGQP